MKWFNKDIAYALSIFSYLGLSIIVNILIFVWLYKLFEKYICESTILFIVFLIVGIINGFYGAYKLIMKK